MPEEQPHAVLAEATDVLSDQLRILLKRLAALLRPHADQLGAQFARRLRRLGYDELQRAALGAITLGAASRFLVRGRLPADFLEQVEYSGRRLAKLNLPPGAVVAALGEYDRLVDPVLEQAAPAERVNYQWAREQLQFCVTLTLNNAYYSVRETETRAFYEMFRAELESRGLEELLARFLAILARFCRADQAQLYLWEGPRQGWVRRAVFPPGGRHTGTTRLARGTAALRALGRPRLLRAHGRDARLVLDAGWGRRHRTVWSVPLVCGQHFAGLLQFAFARNYEWLPRERELLTAAAERCLLAAEKARLVEDLARRERQVRELAERMLHIEEAERRRISRELHDQAGQDLLSIRLQLEMLEGLARNEGHQWVGRLREVRDLTERTIVEIRRLIAALSPAVLEQLGLAAALRQLASRFRQIHPSRVRLHVGRLGKLPKTTEQIVYRLVQECCHNAARHSQCSRVNISVDSVDGSLRLRVADDGVGFDPAAALARRDAFGLAGIRERVALLGGRCEIESRRRGGRGTRIAVELPMPPGEASNG